VRLRDTTEADLPALYEHQADEQASRMAAFPSRDRDAFFAHWRTNVLGNPSGRVKTVEVDGAVVGHVVRWTADDLRLLGYWIDRGSWGRGIASRAVAEFVAGETERPLHAYVATHNAGSIRVLEKCGFVRVAEVRTGTDGVTEYLYRLD